MQPSRFLKTIPQRKCFVIRLLCELDSKLHTHFTGKQVDLLTIIQLVMKMTQDHTSQMSKIQSLPSSLSSLKPWILKHPLVGNMATAWQWKTKGSKCYPKGRFAHQLWRGFPIRIARIMMVPPLWAFVRIVMKQQKCNAVPRKSFLQEIIAASISYWTIYLLYSAAGSIKVNTVTCLGIFKSLVQIKHSVYSRYECAGIVSDFQNCKELRRLFVSSLHLTDGEAEPVREKQKELPKVS